MDAKILPAFWPALAQQPLEVKLTALWCLTNDSRDNCGVFRANARRFAFDTELPEHWLAETLSRLADMFHVEPETDRVLIRNFIRFQIGRGESLQKNNQAKGLHKPFQVLPEGLQRAILDHYPELKPLLSPYQALTKPFDDQQTRANAPSSPPSGAAENSLLSEALGKPLPRVGERGKEGKGTGGESEGNPGDAHIPSADEVAAYGNMQAGIPPEFCRHYHERKSIARTWLNHLDRLIDWRRELRAWWNKARATWKPAETIAPGGSPTLEAIEAELAWNQDETRRAELKKRRDALT